VHLEYILTEILKNSFRATVEHHNKTKKKAQTPLPPVVITISPPYRYTTGDKASSYLSIRVRDQGGGVQPTNMARIFSYAFTTAGRGAEIYAEHEGGPYAAQHIGGAAAINADDGIDGNLFSEMAGKGLQTGMGTIAGLGYGLPMSRLYAKCVPFSALMHQLTKRHQILWRLARLFLVGRMGQRCLCEATLS